MTRQYTRKYTGPEINPDQIPTGTRPDIDMSTAEDMLNRPQEEILLVDKPPKQEYAEALAFAEEQVLIRLERTGSKYQPAIVDFGVNGEKAWVQVGKPQKVKRKFLEVILRSQPFNVSTEHDGTTVERPRNLIARHQSSRHPVSILHDPNPRGAEWVQRIAAES